MAEHSAVNRRVVGSSPTCGANLFCKLLNLLGLLTYHFKSLHFLSNDQKVETFSFLVTSHATLSIIYILSIFMLRLRVLFY